MLEIKNLTIKYKSAKTPAVDGVSLNINEGDFFALVGESGSGKSTLALSVTGLSFIDNAVVEKGEIIFNAKNIASATEIEKQLIRGKEISMIFQDPSSYLNPVTKAGIQVAEAFIAHNPTAQKQEAKQVVLETFLKVQLNDAERIYNSYPHQLSGGQRQRVLIAMAIINSPKLLIADEPTTGLDAITQSQILNLIESLRRDYNMAIMLITHNIRIAKKYSKNVAVMYKGKIVEQGLSEKVFNAPGHEYTKMLLSKTFKAI